MSIGRWKNFISMTDAIRDITEDKQFVRLRKLNSEDNGPRRPLKEDDIEDQGVEAIDNVQNVVLKSSKDDGDLDLGSSETDDGETVLVKTTTLEQGDKHLHVFIQKLKGKERGRFKKDTNEMQSMTRDVDWGSRGSIMDMMVTTPLRNHFQGPAIEQKYSKLKSTLKTNQIKIDEDRIVEIANETITTDFSGFYVLFWMAVAFTVVKVTLQYYEDHDGDFSQSIILQYMTTNLWKVALYDLAMYASTYVAFIIQYLCRKNVLPWKPTGRYLVMIFECLFLAVNIYLPKKTFNYNWIAQIFLFLHSLVYLMKIHSYSFYNGYLWDITTELKYATKTIAKLKELQSPDSNTEVLRKSIDFCEFELNSQSTTTKFPSNLTIKNYFHFHSFPTLVYQIEYPRTKKIRWGYVFEKCCAIFGIIFIMMVVAQQFMLPVIVEAKDVGMSSYTVKEKMAIMPKLLLDLAPAFIAMFLLVWYLIWDAILNCVAELTCFADRHFYSDWWNCCSWYDFSRLWNRPVHSFLLRHVYHSSLSAYNISKIQAVLLTFALSAIFHEMAMYVLFNKVRGYIIVLQMAQIPFTAIANHPLLRDKKLFNNVVFWVGICLGPSITGLLYLIF